MMIIHSEIYTISADTPPVVRDMIRQRLKKAYGDYIEQNNGGVIHLYAKTKSGLEEGKKNEGRAVCDTGGTERAGSEDQDEGREIPGDHADNDTGRDQVRS